MLKVFVFLAFAASVALATSSGQNTTCSAIATWGCQSFDKGDRKKCLDKSPGIMEWVASPVRSTEYSLRTGDAEKNLDPTTYQPDQMLNLFVRTLNYTAKFRGIIIQAMNADGKIVGDFSPAVQETRLVHTPCDNKGVALHLSAEIKPFLMRLRWRAPANGTGTVTFKCLIKKGPPNHGYFYYPNMQDLVLTEAPADTKFKTEWHETTQECGKFCANSQEVVDIASMQRLSDPAAFEKEICSWRSCAMPLVSFCSKSREPFQSQGLFYFQKPLAQCENWRSTRATLPASAQRFCACKTPDSVSGADRKSVNHFLLLSVLVSLFAAGSVPFRLPTLAFALVCCLCLLPVCQAHNWMHTTGRATRVASTVRPCMSRKASDTHVQVGPGQNFAVKWDTGHERDSYFVIIHGKNYEWLADRNVMRYVNDYIQEGVAAGHNKAFDPKYMRYHGTNGDPTKHTESGLFEKEVPPNTISHPTSNQKKMFMYKNSSIQRDIRVSYKSAKYPWLEAVMRYDHKGFVGSPDALNLTIPGFAGVGHYIVWWSWSGFTDCVDVDYLPEKVSTDIVYGKASVPPTWVWNKVDHCQYQVPKGFLSPCYSANDGVDQCIQQMGWRNDGRYRIGVNVVPVTNPASVFSAFRNNTNIPFFHPKCSISTWLRERTGKVTSSDDPWPNWEGETTFEGNQTCTSEWQQKSLSFRDAILYCSAQPPTTCAGIAWQGQKAGFDPTLLEGTRTFRFCRSVEPNIGKSQTGWILAWKKPSTPVAPTPIGALMKFTKSSTPPSGWLTLDAGVFGPRNGTSLQYGWKCGITNGGINFMNNCDGKKAQDPNYWNVKVPNGVYSVNVKWFCQTCPYISVNACTVENVKFLNTATFSDKFLDKTFLVEVRDGTLTMTGGFQLYPNHGGGFGCSTAFQNVTFQKVQESLPPVWMPTSINPWKQIEVDETRPIGIVSLAGIPNDCSLWWLIGSIACPTYGRPYSKVFDEPDAGLVVGVSDSPCKGNVCSGQICGKVMFPWQGDSNSVFFNPQDPGVYYPIVNNNLWIDCKGLKGRYVYVQAVGKKRILHVPTLQVNYIKPLPRPNGEMNLACYGVWARPETNTEPEYITTDDPEDPVFYSTCYVREANVTWLSDEQIQSPPVWKLDQKCITCESFEKSNNPATALVPPVWAVTDKCVNCEVEKKPITLPQQLRSFASKQACDFKPDSTCLDKPADYCRKAVSTANFFAPSTLKQIALVVSEDPECNGQIVGRSTSDPTVWCYRKDPCCRQCSLKALSTSTDLLTPQLPADSTCSSGISAPEKKSASVCWSSSAAPANSTLSPRPCNPSTLGEVPIGERYNVSKPTTASNESFHVNLTQSRLSSSYSLGSVVAVEIQWEMNILGLSSETGSYSTIVELVVGESFPVLFKGHQWLASKICQDKGFHKYRLTLNSTKTVLECDGAVLLSQGKLDPRTVDVVRIGSHRSQGSNFCRMSGAVRNFEISYRSNRRMCCASSCVYNGANVCGDPELCAQASSSSMCCSRDIDSTSCLSSGAPCFLNATTNY